jgi:hypothetical protein
VGDEAAGPVEGGGEGIGEGVLAVGGGHDRLPAVSDMRSCPAPSIRRARL